MSRKRIYRSDLFSPERLTSTDALERALQELQSILTKDNFKHVFQELFDNESPHVLLLVSSSLSKTTSLISWFLEFFPSEAKDYDATVHYKTISCLSTELLSSPFVTDKELCARYHEEAQIAPKALQYLDSFLHSIDIRTQHHNKRGKAKPSQRKLPQVKRDDGASTLVKKYFDVLNVSIPKTSSQAYILVDRILQSQQDTLKFYLKLLCRPEISTSLKECFIVSASPIEMEKNASGTVAEFHPIVQPMKSALYFDTADGFGSWTIVISTYADNILRRAHKKNPTAFNAIVEKIKELSCGQFTDDNQKCLWGSATEVPVFSAKISRSLRLVYQIDIIPGDDQRETQAIKIFGIYTQAQIDDRLCQWSSTSSQLQKKGKEYQKRCAVREHADKAPKDIFTPAFFPSLPEVPPSEIEDIPDLRPEEKAQNHARLITYLRISGECFEQANEDAAATDAIPTQEMTAPEPTEREIAAASLIQRVYKKVLRHRRGVAKRGTGGLHAQIYASCTKEVSRLGDNPGLYLRLFLGPLPHILVCLETVRVDALSQKKKTKDRLKDCSHNEYDAVDDLLTQTNKVNKAAVRLQRHLIPSSAFHERRDSKQLRKLVAEANALVSSLPFGTSLDLSDDLHLAIKGIVTECSSAGTRK
ncbi:uncharacterized protein ARMOST_08583 [Armillaria ostoyae]|uniref:Uncharacterized protein n=1 Tax=Armillaria ostoyae TaxID=47428 RepID=A0A284R915_ARMOS|nr:uncharacterized protein ARMOST_08583 [Armillaria ostoyae]